MSHMRTKHQFAAFAQEAAFVRIADLDPGLHTSCTANVATTLIQTGGLSTPPWARRKIVLPQLLRCWALLSLLWSGIGFSGPCFSLTYTD